MTDDTVPVRQQDALFKLNDELWSMLHARALDGETIESTTVREWLRTLLGFDLDGLGRPLPPGWGSGQE